MALKRTERHYLIETRHPNGYKDGEHRVTVIRRPDGTRAVDAVDFGYSRDYDVIDDASAIKALLREHATTLYAIGIAR